MLLKRFIEAEGYEVVYASNGKVGLELYRDVHPDLILLDINMPEMNGFEVAQTIRETDRRIIIFSSQTVPTRLTAYMASN